MPEPLTRTGDSLNDSLGFVTLPTLEFLTSTSMAMSRQGLARRITAKYALIGGAARGIIAMMRWLRTILSQFFIYLTAAATILAGTPMVQCACPRGSLKAARLASDAAEKCCCCSKDSHQQNPLPSCCQQLQMPEDDGNGPAYRHDGCQKVVVQPHDAAAPRVDGNLHDITANIVASDAAAHDGSVSIRPATIDAPPLPPIDLQLVLQHFVI